MFIFYEQLSKFAPPKCCFSKLIFLEKKVNKHVILTLMNISAKYELPRIIRKGVPDFPPHVKQNLLSNFAQWPLSAHYQYEPCKSRHSGFWRKIGQKWGKSGQAKTLFNIWQ